MKPSFAAALTASSLLAGVSGYDITFDKALIPAIKGQWPYLKLGPVVQLPADFLNQVLKNVAPSTKWTNSTGGRAGGMIAQDGDRTVGLVDPVTGETSIYPKFESLRSAPNISSEFIQKHIDNPSVIPHDDSSVTALPGMNLYGTTRVRDGKNDTVPAVFLTNVVAQRSIHVPDAGAHFPVRGNASKAVFGVGADGNLQSLAHVWHPAKLGGSTITPRPRDEIYNAIIAQLKSFAEISPVTVDSVEPCFFDAGAAFIQPVFYFAATIQSNPRSKIVNQTHARISGYIPLGRKPLESLPDLNKPGDITPPAFAPADTGAPEVPKARRSYPPSLEKRGNNIKVGRYVVRADSSAWVASANDFLSTLIQYSAPILPWFPRFVTFLNSQYYWAQPFIFTSSKESFIDSVHIADTEVHGNWHLFSTYQNWGDIVSLSDIPASGYGGGAGGSLAYWILHSCEVIPTDTDYPPTTASKTQSYDAWWKIFNGLHAVVGYRTEMWIADGATTPFAKAIARGFPVVPAWMKAVHDDMIYAPSPGNIYYDGNRKINEPMGRASSISVCGHTDDVVWQVANLGKATCLHEWWYDN
ncbi:hypothetical protein MMC30_001258 [Trapelia coarctata]|nr:hypothetical protein [Trapelia coarctata]